MNMRTAHGFKCEKSKKYRDLVGISLTFSEDLTIRTRIQWLWSKFRRFFRNWQSELVSTDSVASHRSNLRIVDILTMHVINFSIHSSKRNFSENKPTKSINIRREKESLYKYVVSFVHFFFNL